MDSTYKTNRYCVFVVILILMNSTHKIHSYKMPLCVFTEVINLNTSFYFAFVFLSSEYAVNYQRVLEQYHILCNVENIPNPTVIATDDEKGLISAIHEVFPETHHVLCLWHVNKNVIVNCKSSFDDNEIWSAFLKAWYKVLYAITEEEYEAR